MAKNRTTPEEQLKLIEECRQSGLTDYDWCREQGIPPKTFYMWIYRLHKKGYTDIPAPVATPMPRDKKKAERPDIVQIQIEPTPAELPAHETSTAYVPYPSACNTDDRAVMELNIGGVQMRITNGINPQMLAETIRLLRGAQC